MRSHQSLKTRQELNPEVLARAVDEQRIILTFDRDYGELIYRFRLPPPKGVIYL